MVPWAKVSADIYSNRKIRKAGPIGREVFVFVLVQNAAREATGAIPALDLEAWYVADMLQVSEQQASEGIERAIDAGLISVTQHEVVICGWDEHWGRRSLTEAERKRRQRARLKSGQVTSDVRTDVTDAAAGLDGHAEEKNKKNKKTGAAHVAARNMAVAAVAEINRLGGTRYEAESEETLAACRRLSKAGVSTEQVVAAVAHVGKQWVGTQLHDKIRPATLLQLKRVRDAIEDIAARGQEARAVEYVLPASEVIYE